MSGKLTVYHTFLTTRLKTLCNKKATIQKHLYSCMVAYSLIRARRHSKTYFAFVCAFLEMSVCDFFPPFSRTARTL